MQKTKLTCENYTVLNSAIVINMPFSDIVNLVVVFFTF